MSAQEEAPNYTKQSLYFRSSFQLVTHIGPTEFSGARIVAGATESSGVATVTDGARGQT